MNQSATNDREEDGFGSSILPGGMQGRENQEREGRREDEVHRLVKTLMDLLLEDREEEAKRIVFRDREQMLEENDLNDRRKRRRVGWKGFREMLAFKNIGCCGNSWSSALQEIDVELPVTPRTTELRGIHREEEEITEIPTGVQQQALDEEGESAENRAVPSGEITEGATRGAVMNLATALAEERRLRAAQEQGVAEAEEGWVGGGGWCCCVCMVRGKGAAFIPCGHSFCRVCSRELWLSRGSCPLCNRQILDVLDIF